MVDMSTCNNLDLLRKNSGIIGLTQTLPVDSHIWSGLSLTFRELAYTRLQVLIFAVRCDYSLYRSNLGRRLYAICMIFAMRLLHSVQ